MPATYKCDRCDEAAPSLAGWFLVSVSFLHEDPNQPTPPGGRTLDATAPDRMFHSTTCRDAWCAAAGLAAPGTRPTAGDRTGWPPPLAPLRGDWLVAPPGLATDRDLETAVILSLF